MRSSLKCRFDMLVKRVQGDLAASSCSVLPHFAEEDALQQIREESKAGGTDESLRDLMHSEVLAYFISSINGTASKTPLDGQVTVVRAEDDDVQLAGKQDMAIVLGIDGVMRANESTPVPAGALFIHRGGPLALKGEDAAAAGVLLSAAAARE